MGIPLRISTMGEGRVKKRRKKVSTKGTTKSTKSKKRVRTTKSRKKKVSTGSKKKAHFVSPSGSSSSGSETQAGYHSTGLGAAPGKDDLAHANELVEAFPEDPRVYN